MPLIISCLSALASAPPNASPADAARANQFLNRYRGGSAPLVNAYQHVHVVASMHDFYVQSGKHRDWRLELLQNGDRYKITEYPTAGDTRRWRRIDVLTPESQFSLTQGDDGKLRRSRAVGDPFLALAQAKDQFRVRSRLLRSPFSYLEEPLCDWLANARIAIHDVAEEKSGGRDLIRVRLSYEPLARAEQGISHSGLVPLRAGCSLGTAGVRRSEERRVGKECRSRW